MGGELWLIPIEHVSHEYGNSSVHEILKFDFQINVVLIQLSYSSNVFNRAIILKEYRFLSQFVLASFIYPIFIAAVKKSISEYILEICNGRRGKNIYCVVYDYGNAKLSILIY